PKAMRKPISLERCPTTYDITPYTPAIARATAKAAKTPSRRVRNRGAATFSLTDASIVVNFTGTSEESDCAFCRMVSERALGSSAVRNKMLKYVEGPGCCW